MRVSQGRCRSKLRGPPRRVKDHWSTDCDTPPFHGEVDLVVAAVGRRCQVGSLRRQDGIRSPEPKSWKPRPPSARSHTSRPVGLVKGPMPCASVRGYSGGKNRKQTAPRWLLNTHDTVPFTAPSSGPIARSPAARSRTSRPVGLAEGEGCVSGNY